MKVSKKCRDQNRTLFFLIMSLSTGFYKGVVEVANYKTCVELPTNFSCLYVCMKVCIYACMYTGTSSDYPLQMRN